MDSAQEKCVKCGAPEARASCAICKDVVYCNDLCGAEDWDEHVRECNVAMVDQHIDFILVPEGYKMDEGAPDFIVQCPNPEGTAMVEYAMSEIGLQEDSKDVFFPSKELKSRAKGVALDFSNKDIGTEYGFSITVKDFNDNTVIDSLILRGLDLKRDAKPTGRRSRGIKNEIVLKPNLKAAVSADPDANLIDIDDTTKSSVFVFQLFQNKRIGSEIMQKIVFDARGIMPPGAIFTRGNALGSTGRRFFTTLFTRGSSVSTPYQTKMQGSLNDVKIAMVFIKDKNRTDATLEDIYFKIPPADFRRGKWNNLNADLEDGATASLRPLVESKVDPYNLIDVTDLCFDLEERIEALGDLIGNEESETYKREYMRNQSRARHYLTILKPHQVDLQAGIGDEFEADYKVLTTISAAQKLEHIDAFFSVSVKAERKKELKRSGRSNLRTLLKSAKTTIAQGDPKTFEGKFGSVKAFSSRVARRGRGFRKKYKGRLLAFQDLIHTKKNNQAPPGVSDWPTPQNVQDVLDVIAESLLTSTA